MGSEIRKLGIAVVYLVSERNGKLLDLHLDQIEKNTDVPYTIYGSANRLLPQFRNRLEGNPNVRICDCETFDISGWKNCHDVAEKSRYEHSFYLEQLIRKAIDDGVSHVAILHVDSFPIIHGWARELASKLSKNRVLAAVVRNREADCKPLTAGMLFHRDFYLRYHPRLLPTEQEFASVEYERYRIRIPHSKDSGCGYGFKIFTEGLTWYPLDRSNAAENHPVFAGVYGHLLFHFGALAFKEANGYVGFSLGKKKGGILPAMILLQKALDRLVGKRFRRSITDRIPLHIRRPDEYRESERWERERQLLLDDPESRLEFLRSGTKSL
jgi:hypothetical protein